MIRIRYSGGSNGEVELEGTKPELSELRAKICEFCESSEQVIVLGADSEFDPVPYDQRLQQVYLRKSDEAIFISVKDGYLCITGKPELLQVFADNLPCTAQRTSSIPYHVHFDRLGREDHVSESSLDIILALRDEFCQPDARPNRSPAAGSQ